MNQKQASKPDEPLEGEGSYQATRRYNQHLAEAIEGGDLEAGAEAARQALEGPEAKELERAAAQAKQGPRPKASTAAPPAKSKESGK